MFFIIKNINYNIRYFYAFFKERMSLRNKLKESEKNMGKVLKVREVGDPILEKQCNEINIKNINGDIIDIIEDLKLEYPKGCIIAKAKITDCIYVDDNFRKKVIPKNPNVYKSLNRTEWKGYAFKIEEVEEI